MNKVVPKKVNLTELFYDLVFVYAISQVTSLIHHIPENSNFLNQLIIFSVVTLVFINTWMIETVFTNRYGTNSIVNIVFFMIDMAILLFMSNNFSLALSQWFRPFVLAAALLSITLVMQYAIVRATKKNKIDRDLSTLFIFIVSIRALLLLIAVFLPLRLGIIIALVGIISSWLLPAFFSSKMKVKPVNFPHLLERLTALIIIMFGETIVDISEYFKLGKFSWYSILIFVIVCSLFMNYITQFDHFIEEKQVHETGVRLIYLHYPILFGISLITVALSFISESDISKLLSVSVLYAGIILFYIGLFLSDYYNKEYLNKSFFIKLVFALITVAGFTSSLVTQTFANVVISTSIVTFINAFIMSLSMVKQSNNQL